MLPTFILVISSIVCLLLLVISAIYNKKFAYINGIIYGGYSFILYGIFLYETFHVSWDSWNNDIVFYVCIFALQGIPIVTLVHIVVLIVYLISQYIKNQSKNKL